MCGRFTQTVAFNVLAERFGITVEDGTNEEVTARYNLSPTQTIPIIITASNKGRRLVMAKWGFQPAWSKPGRLAPHGYLAVRGMRGGAEAPHPQQEETDGNL